MDIPRSPKKKGKLYSSGNNHQNASDPVSSEERGSASEAVVTDVDLEIKVTLSRSVLYQTGSQAYPISHKSSFLDDESQLSAEVTKTIEAREMELYKLQVESERVQRQYLDVSDNYDELDIYF